MLCVAAAPTAVSPLAGGDDGVVHVWEVAPAARSVVWRGMTTPSKASRSRPMAAATVSTGGAKDQTVRIWEMASGRQIRCLRGFQGGLALH